MASLLYFEEVVGLMALQYDALNVKTILDALCLLFVDVLNHVEIKHLILI